MSFIYKKAFRRALGKPAGKSIPLTGEVAAKNDCYVITVKAKDSAWSGWVMSSSDAGVICKIHETADETKDIVWGELPQLNVQIKHYFRYFTFQYESPLEMLLWEWTGYYRFLVLKEKVTQSVFNKIKLTRADRIEVLRHFVKMESDRGSYKASCVDLVTNLHSMRAFGRSDVDLQMHYYELICESLVVSKDLSKSGIEYAIMPQAITTLSAYEEEDRRHREMRRQQLLVVLLTAALVIVGLVQAYITYQGITIR